MISLDESFEKRPERAVDQEIKQFKEFIKERRINWTEEEKIELETDKFDNDESLKNSSIHFSEMLYSIVDHELKDYINKEFKIIGFDESSNTFSGTYARLASFKFGEGQVIYKLY